MRKHGLGQLPIWWGFYVSARASSSRARYSSEVGFAATHRVISALRWYSQGGNCLPIPARLLQAFSTFPQACMVWFSWKSAWAFVWGNPSCSVSRPVGIFPWLLSDRSGQKHVPTTQNWKVFGCHSTTCAPFALSCSGVPVDGQSEFVS